MAEDRPDLGFLVQLLQLLIAAVAAGSIIISFIVFQAYAAEYGAGWLLPLLADSSFKLIFFVSVELSVIFGLPLLVGSYTCYMIIEAKKELTRQPMKREISLNYWAISSMILSMLLFSYSLNYKELLGSLLLYLSFVSFVMINHFIRPNFRISNEKLIFRLKNHVKSRFNFELYIIIYGVQFVSILLYVFLLANSAINYYPEINTKNYFFSTLEVTASITVYLAIYYIGFQISSFFLRDTQQNQIVFFLVITGAIVVIVFVASRFFPLQNYILRSAGIGAFYARIQTMPTPGVSKTENLLVIADVDKFLFVQNEAEAKAGTACGKITKISIGHVKSITELPGIVRAKCIHHVMALPLTPRQR